MNPYNPYNIWIKRAFIANMLFFWVYLAVNTRTLKLVFSGLSALFALIAVGLEITFLFKTGDTRKAFGGFLIALIIVLLEMVIYKYTE